MPSGRPETPMPVDMEAFVSDVGYCPKCRYALTAHDFACDAIGRLVLTHRCKGKPPVPCRYVPSVEELKGAAGYEAALAAGAYTRKEVPLCACGCGERASSRRTQYATACLKRLRKVWGKAAGFQTQRARRAHAGTT